MAYTSIIINNGEENVGSPIGLSIPNLLDNLEKGEMYVLQFAVRNLNDSTSTLNYIYVGEQKLQDITIKDYSSITIDDVTFYNCYIQFIASNKMT